MNRYVYRLAYLFMALIFSGCSLSYFNAATNGDTEKVLALLKDGIDVNTTFPIVRTHALMVAAAFGHVDTVGALIERGADVNAKDLTGWTPLHAAAFKGNMQIVRLLLEKGAVAEPSTWFLESPWVMAEELGYTAIVPLLKQAEWQTVASRHPLPCIPQDFVTNNALISASSQHVC
jgi:ankyrin repeat protein